MRKTENIRHIVLLFLIGCGTTVIFACLLSMLYHAKGESLPTATGTIRQDFSVVESEGGMYFGEILGTDYSGEGSFQHLSEGLYTGTYEDSKREGKGVFIWSNGDSFDGTWSADQMHEGTYTFANGHTFNGTFEDNNFDDGIYRLGTDCEAKGFTQFEATISDGIILELNFTTNTGLTYSGEVTGEAKITYPSGNVYEGDVVQGERSGTGTFKWYSNNNLIGLFSGSWKNGQMDGNGTYYYSANSYPYLVGTFVAGKPDGTATYYKEAGNAFITTWLNGKCTKAVED